MMVHLLLIKNGNKKKAIKVLIKINKKLKIIDLNKINTLSNNIKSENKKLNILHAQ